MKTKTEAREWLNRSAAHCGFTDANFQQPKKTMEEFRADQTMQNMAERVQFMNLLNADEIAWPDLYGEYVREYTETAGIISGLKGSEEMGTKKEALRPEIVAGVAMLSKDEAAAALMVSPAQLDRFRLCGLLKATKTGQGWRYSQGELLDFQKDLRGIDVSNEAAMLQALKYRSAA